MAEITTTWNSITLKFLVNSEFTPGTPGATISEIPILPDPDDLDAVASVLQQGPSLRDRVSGKCYVSSMTDYQTLKTAYKSGTTATLAIGAFINATYMISHLGAPRYVQSDYIDFDIEFVEV